MLLAWFETNRLSISRKENILQINSPTEYSPEGFKINTLNYFFFKVFNFKF